MTKVEIIQETADFYSADMSRISLNDRGRCVFNGENGTHCAIGRCLLPHLQEQGYALNGNTKSFSHLVKMNNPVITIEFEEFHDLGLQEKYHGHSYMFWRDLQGLHDTVENWSENGLTLIGETAVKELKRIHSN